MSAADQELLERFNRDAWVFCPLARSAQHVFFARSPFSFFRGAPYLFYAAVTRSAPPAGELAAAGKLLGEGPIFGDAHPANLGLLRKKNGDAVVVNDYDDVTTGPRLWDLIRGYVGLRLLWPEEEPEAMAVAFAKGYAHGLAGEGDDERVAAVLAEMERLVDATPVEPEFQQPAPPPGAEAAAEVDVLDYLGKPTGDFAKSCERLDYLVLRGGSSMGLPRFRARCGDSGHVEIKGARMAALDAALGKKGGDSGAARIAKLAPLLAPKSLGAFRAMKMLAQVPAFKPFTFYGHLRATRKIEVTVLRKTKHRVDFGRLCGLAIGDGHRRSGRGEIDKGLRDSLAAGLAAQTEAWEALVHAQIAALVAAG